MERPRMRPLFKLALPIAAARLMAEIESRLEQPGSPFIGTVLRRHVALTVRDADRHFWSPHLSVDVLAEGSDTTLRGRYAPHPNIWTGIMASYAVLGMCAIAGSMYGMSQWILGWPPWALLAIPASAAGAAATWMAAAVGQRLAMAQMHALHDFFQDCIRNASDPPAPPAPNEAEDTRPAG